jgi:phosphate transport system substrate-binding protein
MADDSVTLRSQDDAVNLTGELLSFDSDTYVIRTKLGDLRISADRVECEGARCPKPAVVEVAEKELFTSGIVTLAAPNGSTQLTGTLIDFDGESYTIETGFGTLKIAVDEAVCSGDACPLDRTTQREVAIAASRDVSEGLVARLIEGFASHNNAAFSATPLTADQVKLDLGGGDDKASVTLASSSSTDAVRSLIGGSADLAATTRPVLDAERGALGTAANASNETVIALDAIAIAVSPQNPVKAINKDDMSRIFSGEISDWEQLGGAPGPINLYVRNAGAGTAVGFEQIVMQPAAARISTNAEILGSDADVSTAVANDPRGIGITSFSAIGGAKALDLRGACGIQTPVTDFTVKTEEYPLTRRIYMYKPRTSIPQAAADIVDFIKSNDGQTIVNASGFVGQDVVSLSVNEQGLRFLSASLPLDLDAGFSDVQRMMTEFSASNRLSLTFRFEPGSTNLDIRAQQDVQRLASKLRAGQFQGKELVIAGFSDSQGPGDANLALSRARAQQVVRAVLEAAGGEDQIGGARLRAVGYGEVAPLRCNDSERGRGINRRVEVWLKDLVASSEL